MAKMYVISRWGCPFFRTTQDSGKVDYVCGVRSLLRLHEREDDGCFGVSSSLCPLQKYEMVTVELGNVEGENEPST